MHSGKRLSILLGILIVLGLITGILSSVPALEKPDYLQRLSKMAGQVYFAVFAQALMAVTYVSIACLMVPLLKRGSEGLAIAYFGFRIVGAAFLFAGIATLLLLLFVSEKYALLAHSPLDDRTLGAVVIQMELFAEMARMVRDWLNHVAMVLPWAMGGLLMFLGLQSMRIVPAWIYLWGFIASGLTLLATLLLMLNIIQIVSAAYMLMNAPMALLEISFSFWPFLEGFPEGPAGSIVELEKTGKGARGAGQYSDD